MRQFAKFLVGAMSALSLAVMGSATALANDEHRILVFNSMTPVTGTAVGPAVNDRGLIGGGLPWAITSGSGSVTRNGHVEVGVTGLVIPARGNTNPVANFRAVVSCIAQHHVIVNVSTGLFPASTAGDSTIVADVTLPRHCSHPLLFVTSPGAAWFAVSNPSSDDEDGD
jgi:hypothetical protein